VGDVWVLIGLFWKWKFCSILLIFPTLLFFIICFVGHGEYFGIPYGSRVLGEKDLPLFVDLKTKENLLLLLII